MNFNDIFAPSLSVNRAISIASVLFATSAFIPSAAFGQIAAEQAGSDGQIQDIVVTAQKRSESSQKVPLSITALSNESLQARGISDVVGLATSVPGFTAQVYNGSVVPFLRGVGSLGSAITNEPSVGIYVDGIYFPRVPSSFFELRNVDRVEVLKGPQGTLFGRNSTGGIINVVTRDPSSETQVMGSVGYGRFDAFQGDLYATTGLGERAAIDFTVSGKTDDGYGRNLTLNKRYSFLDSILLRSKLLFEPADGTKIVISGFYAGSKTSGSKAAYPGTTTGTFSAPNEVFSSTPIPGVPTRVIGYYDTVEDYEAKDIFHMWGGYIRADHDLAFARITSISAYSHEKEKNYSDSDYGPRPDQTVPFFGQVKLFTQELQIASLPADEINWIAGLFYYNNATAYPTIQINNVNLPGGALQAPGSSKSISYAVFGQATYEILPALKVTGGIRYTKDKVSGKGRLAFLTTPITVIPLPDSTTKNNKVTFRAALDYQLARESLIYASFSRGYKAGKYNILTYNPVPTDPETLDAYELGLKTDLLDRRLRINGAIFYFDITNPQVQTQTNTTIVYSNADSARVKGAELDIQGALSRNFTLRASATYLDAKYKRYGALDPVTGACINCAPASIADLVNGGAISVPGGIVADGNRTPLAAKFTYTLGGDIRFSVVGREALISVDWFHSSGFYNEPDTNNLFQKPYGVLNGQLRYAASDNMSVRFWGKNLLDKKYAISAGTNVGPAGYPWNPAPPRTYGVAFDFNF